jgi:uncharacterized membrane protein
MNILICKKCGSEADLNKDPKSANGWQVVPTVICAECIEKDLASRPTHALVEEKSHYRGKVIATLTLIPLDQGRQA